MDNEKNAAQNRTDTHHDILQNFFIVTLFLLIMSCNFSKKEPNEKLQERVSGNIALELFRDPGMEILTDEERASIIKLLAEVKTKKVKFPGRVGSPSPSPRMKYLMNISMVSGSQHRYYFRDDGMIMNIDGAHLHAYFSDNEKADELARIIVGVGERLKNIEPLIQE